MVSSESTLRARLVRGFVVELVGRLLVVAVTLVEVGLVDRLVVVVVLSVEVEELSKILELVELSKISELVVVGNVSEDEFD